MQKWDICAILLLFKVESATGVSSELRKLKLLIADACEEIRIALEERLRNTYTICGCGEGNEALAIIRSFRPDVMILDVMLPGLDGITLLQRVAQEGFNPVILVTTRFCSDYVQRCLSLFRVAYLMIKPCEIEATAERLSDLVRLRDTPCICRPDPRILVTNMLLSLGFDAQLKGFSCLVDAIAEKMRDPTQQITKEIYVTVAENSGGNKEQVERVIRSAIGKAFASRDENLWRICFQTDRQGEFRCPSNGTFISCIAARIKMTEDLTI